MADMDEEHSTWTSTDRQIDVYGESSSTVEADEAPNAAQSQASSSD